MVSLLRLAISSLIFWPRESEVFLRLLLTSNWGTPYTKQSMEVQPDERNIQILEKHHDLMVFLELLYLFVWTVRCKVRREWSLFSSPVAKWLALRPLCLCFSLCRCQRIFGMECKNQRQYIDPSWAFENSPKIAGAPCSVPDTASYHQRMNANGNSTKWFIFLKQ